MKNKVERVRISFTKNQFIVLIIVLLFLFLLFLYFYTQRPITTINYLGEKLTFRQDLREANKIKVYPSEKILQDLMNGTKIRNVTIAYKKTSDISYTLLEAVEITYKLRRGYLAQGYDFKIVAKEFDSLENITGEQSTPIIVLIPPSIANETSVRVKDSAVYISGKDLKNFDLATIKFLVVTLKIRV